MVLPCRELACLLLAVVAMTACAPRRELPPEPTASVEPAGPPRPLPPLPEPILLHASKAKVHGTSARYEKGKNRDNIGFWFNAADYVTWDFELPQPATFLVQITTATPANTAGSVYAVVVGDEELRGVVKSTGDWGNFVTEPLGTIELKRAGKHTLAVKIIEKRGGAVMNLQAVRLVPGRWEPGLVAWWRFDEGKGTETEDWLGGAKDALHYTRWTRGASRSGLRLNGVSSHVVREAALAPALRNGLTIEAWVKLDEASEGWRPVVNCHDYPLGYFFGFDAAGDLGLHLGVGGRWVDCTSRVRPRVGEWTHVAATYDHVMGARIYVNGQETGRTEVGGDLAPAEGVDLVIGRHNRHPWALDGAIDEVRIYDRAVRPDAIREHYEEEKANIRPPSPIAIRAVRPDRPAASIYERVTLDVDLQATYDNPFDADDIRLDCAVAAPSRKTWTVPGFLYQRFTRRLDGDKEVVEPGGEPRWQVRLSFTEPGTHHLRVTATDRTGTAMSEPLRIEALPADAPGMIRREGRYFVTDRGESYFPVGANVCWGLAAGTLSYDKWLPKYAEHGCNAFRVWLSPHWTTFGMNTAASGFDAIDQGNAWRLDHVLETAEQRKLRVMLCIDSFNILRSVERSPGVMEEAPTTRANGGPVVKPLDYFTKPASLRAYRNRLRYLVARYGYSPSVFAWEFWNEVDIIDGYDAATVAGWHAEMARYLHTLDPWRHLITTSHASPKGDPLVDKLPELDFVQSHRYGGNDMALEMGKDIAAKEAAKSKPHFHGEFGISGDGKQTADADPTGIHVHNALFASVGGGHAGAPMTWWWDSYVEPKNLYPLFAAFAGWIEGFDFVAERPRPIQAKLVGEMSSVEEGLLVLDKGKWEPAPCNQPITVRIDRKGVMTATASPSELLHGLGHHKDKHNPVTFDLDVPEPSTLGVEVEKHSGFGNGHLEIHVDRKLVLEQDFPVPKDNKKDTLTEGAGLYAVPIPAGRHTVIVRNTGKDWISLKSYRIPWLKVLKKVVDPLRVSGLLGDTMALVWVQNKRHIWSQAAKKQYKPLPVDGASLQLAGLRPGRWTIEHYDTHQGKTTKTEEATVARDGLLTVRLPAIAWDAALRLKKMP